MSIPTYANLMWPLLKVLSQQPGEIHVSDICQIIADELQLSKEDRIALLPSGSMPVLRNRIGWAHDALKRAKLSSAVKWGKWFITDEGRDFVKKHPNGITEEEKKGLATANRSVKLAEIWGGDAGTKPPVIDVQTETPEESIGNALLEIKKRVSGELLDEIYKQDPAFFERLVLDLLLAMGYGADEKSLNVVGKSGDGGIDGIISQDRLGLDKVYVQAKRWKNSVGSPEIQTFFGALNIKGAAKGVFITTGEVTQPALDMVKAAQGKIVVVDGERLTDLMMEFGVGVANSVIKVPKIDKDYFEV
jgi:restriction system protein